MELSAFMRPTFRLSWLLPLFLLLLAAQFVASRPLAAPDAATQAQLITLYDTLLEDPTNINLTLEYARLAAASGDYEAAIPPLERLLMSNPNAPQIMLELGVLYYQLNAFDIARSYFLDAKAQAAGNDALIQKADAYLKGM